MMKLMSVVYRITNISLPLFSVIIIANIACVVFSHVGHRTKLPRGDLVAGDQPNEKFWQVICFV